MRNGGRLSSRSPAAPRSWAIQGLAVAPLDFRPRPARHRCAAEPSGIWPRLRNPSAAPSLDSQATVPGSFPVPIAMGSPPAANIWAAFASSAARSGSSAM